MRTSHHRRLLVLGLLALLLACLPAQVSTAAVPTPASGPDAVTAVAGTSPAGGVEAPLIDAAYDLAGSAGDAHPVDPGTRADDGTVVPRTAQRGVRSAAPDGAAAPGDRPTVAITPPASGEGRSLDGHAVVYDGEAPDTAVLVEQTRTDIPRVASATRMHLLIGDAAAPTRYEFDLDLPAGGRLVPTDDGGVRALDADGGVIGLVAPPWANDAAGEPVPTRYLVEGRTLVQEVLHRGATYPVVADPWWFVPVVVAGSRVVAKIAVRAKNASAARQAAARAAVRRGHRVRRVGAPVRGTFFTAAGHQIRVGGRFSRANGYDSFAAFKRAHPGRRGYEWHHIAEQANVGRFGSRLINNKQNLILIRSGLHRGCINRFMNTALGNLTRAELQALRVSIGPDQGNWTLRQALTGYSLRNLHLVGLRLLALCGVRISGSGI